MTHKTKKLILRYILSFITAFSHITTALQLEKSKVDEFLSQPSPPLPAEINPLINQQHSSIISRNKSID